MSEATARLPGAAIAAACLLLSGALGSQNGDSPLPLIGPEGPFDIGASLELEWAPGLHSGPSQKLGLLFEPELEAALPFELELTAIGRLRVDAKDELEPGEPDLDSYSRATRPAALGERGELELRELYLDGALGPMLLRIGKQQVVWGQADGLKVLDVVNPQDWSEFILDEFEDSRIPLWTVNAEIPFRSSVLQLLFVPDPTVHRLMGLDSTDPDELYAATAPMFRPEAPVTNLGLTTEGRLEPRARRRWKWSNSDLGARLATVWKGWDLSVNYLYHFDDFPVLERGDITFRFDRANRRIVAAVEVEPVYERKTLVGGTFSRNLGSLTLRGEVAYSFGRAFSTVRESERDGIVETDEVAYVIGADWHGWRDGFLSAQFFQTLIPDHQDGMLPEERSTNLTLLVQRRLLRDRLSLQTILLHNLGHADGLVRPRIEFFVSDQVWLWMGADVFYGSAHGPFGQFDHNDRIVFGFGWRI